MLSTTSHQKRWEIVFLKTHPLGPKLSNQKIADHTGVSLSTVKFWLKRFKKTEDVADLPRSGRPKALSEKEEGVLENLLEKNPNSTSTVLTEKLKCKNIEVSSRTVRRRLNEMGLKFGNTLSKPLLSETHCEKRLQWAQENQNREWGQVIFTDEATINLGVRRKKVWHRPGAKLVIRTFKHPVKVNIWGCVSNKGFGQCYVFTDNLNSDKLVKIYKRALLPSILKLFGSTDLCVLQEDNDPKHTSKKAAKWREEHNIKRMEWPAQSPDQNCIENVWNVLKIRVSEKHPKNLKELVSIVKRE